MWHRKNPMQYCLRLRGSGQHWAIPEKIQREGVEVGDIFFENPPEIFHFLLYPWKSQTKQSSNPGYSTKLLETLEIPTGQKQRLLGIPYYFFLVSLLGNSTSFLINPWKFHMLFLWYPWKFHILSKHHPVWIFFWKKLPIAQEKIQWDVIWTTSGINFSAIGLVNFLIKGCCKCQHCSNLVNSQHT